MSALTNHAMDRAFDRIAAAGIAPHAILDRAAKAAHKIPASLDSAAILMVRLKAHVGDTNLDHHARADSNGDNVWAIVRRNDAGTLKVRTLMLRRSDQPSTAAALRVDKVFVMKGAAA